MVPFLVMRCREDVVEVEIEPAERSIRTDNWGLDYAMTVSLSQGLAIYNSQKIWIIDDYLQ